MFRLRVSRARSGREVSLWLAMVPVYGGLGAYLMAQKLGISELGAFGATMACVIALTAAISA